MSLITRLAGALSPRPALDPARLAALEPPARRVAAFASGDTGGTTTAPAISTLRAQAVARSVALSIPAVRKARGAILTIATFRLAAWTDDGRRLPPEATPPILAQLERNRTPFRSLALLLDDGIWYDRSVWRVHRDISRERRPAYLERVHPQRIQPIPHPLDPDQVVAWYLDGTHYTDDELRRDHVVFDFAGMGGLRNLGAELLNLYGDLQRAAGRYARAPHPWAILKNRGADLTDEEIDELLDEWELSRETRGVGYVEGDLDYDVTQGFSARELQLVEAREHAALEVARMFQLPAHTVDAAPSGGSLRYETTVENRRDTLEALRPWMAPITQGLSMRDRLSPAGAGLILPARQLAEFDADAYLRDDPKTRMETWRAGLDMDLWDVDDVRAMEPLARKA